MPNKCLGAFLIFLAFPFILLTIFFLSTQQLYQSSFYKNIFSSTNSYSKIASSINQTETDNTLVKAITSDITPAWVKTNTESNLDKFFAYVNHDTNTLSPGLDIRPFKSDIQNQIPKGINITVPDELSLDTYNAFLTDISNNLNSLSQNAQLNSDESASIKQQINSSINTKTQISQNFSNIRKGFTYFKYISYTIFILTFLLLVLIAFIARRYPPAAFSFLGQALFYPSVFLALLMFLLSEVMSHYSPFNSISISTQVKQIISPIYDAFLGKIIFNMEILSIILAVIGLIYIIIFFVYGAFYHKKQPVKPMTLAHK